MSTNSYPVSTIAKLLLLSERRVQQLASQGIIPRPVDGKYNLVGSISGYINYIRQDKTTVSEAEKERTRLSKVQADKTELEMDMMTRKLVAIDEVKSEVGDVFMRFRNKILSIPSRAASLLTGSEDYQEREKCLKELTHEALQELSYDPKG